MTDVNDLVQEFWSTSSDGAVWFLGTSFFPMRRLFGVLQKCLGILKVRSSIISVFLQLPPTSADGNLQTANWSYSAQSDPDKTEFRDKFNITFDEYRKMFDQSISKSKDLAQLDDMLKLLPGVVVQKYMSIQGMADLYGIKPDLLERLIKSSILIEQLKPSRYVFDHYLSDFLRDRDRSLLYYCDPILQHISICRQFLSLMDESKTVDLQS